MKLAILSGTFNPIHKAHILLAEYVKSHFKYDKILVIPAYKPPFKEQTAEANMRLEMAKIAVKSVDGVEVSDIEFKLGGKSYSVLTLKELYKKYDIDGKIGFIIGTDAYRHLNMWYNERELKELADFIVFERDFSFDDKDVKLRQQEGFNLIKAEMPFVDISSTEIREKIASGERVEKYLPDGVERYINEHKLYK